MCSMQAIPTTAAVFDGAAERYDEIFTNSLIGRAQRQVVWEQMERVFSPGSSLLELNCGTGEDAFFLARKGMNVVAFDQSPNMIEVAIERRNRGAVDAVSFSVLDTQNLSRLSPEKKFQGAFSNFGGLNCVSDVPGVAEDLASLLEPGAPLVLCTLGPSCLWEICWYALQGKWKKALRRLKGSTEARIGSGQPFEIHYYSTAALQVMFWPFFRLKFWKGVGIAVPPSYLEPWAARFPRLLRALIQLDRWWGSVPGVRGMADHILLVFERT